MKEDYVNFEIAKLLKEKGFNWCTKSFYKNNSQVIRHNTCTLAYYSTKEKIPAPTLQMAMKWLKEKGFYIFVPIEIDYDEDERGKKWYYQPAYYPEILRVSDGKSVYDDGSLYATPEQAIDVAIKYCLTNLI